MVSVRLPSELIKQLDQIAEEYGWTMTDVAQTALDFYVQSLNKDQKRKK